MCINFCRWDGDRNAYFVNHGFERFGVGLGASYALGWMAIDVAYLFAQNADRTVTDAKPPLVAPLVDDATQIVNNGDYEANLQTFSLGLTFHFDENPTKASTPIVQDLDGD